MYNIQSESDKLCEGVGECDCEGCNCPAPYDGEHCENLVRQHLCDTHTHVYTRIYTYTHTHTHTRTHARTHARTHTHTHTHTFQILEDCFDIATELEIERCILEEKNRTNDNSVCQTCSFSLINVVNVSCVVLIPESEQPRTSDVDEVERIIEEFAAKELTGRYILPLPQ